MNKQTKMLLGIGAVAVVGYLIWKQGQKPKASAVGRLGGRDLCTKQGQVCGVNGRCMPVNGRLICISAETN